jgi:hypothetical protein
MATSTVSPLPFPCLFSFFYFYNHGIIIDNTFCGTWARSVYPGGNDACISFVQNNPSTLSFYLLSSLFSSLLSSPLLSSPYHMPHVTTVGRVAQNYALPHCPPPSRLILPSFTLLLPLLLSFHLFQPGMFVLR